MSYELIILLSILIHQQDNDSFQLRETATDKLTKIVQKYPELKKEIIKKGVSPEAKYRCKQVYAAGLEAELENLKHAKYKNLPTIISGYKVKDQEYTDYSSAYDAAVRIANENENALADWLKVYTLIEEVSKPITISEYIENSKKDGLSTEIIIQRLKDLQR
jgi:hypothetical protein